MRLSCSCAVALVAVLSACQAAAPRVLSPETEPSFDTVHTLDNEVPVTDSIQPHTINLAAVQRSADENMPDGREGEEMHPEQAVTEGNPSAGMLHLMDRNNEGLSAASMQGHTLNTESLKPVVIKSQAGITSLASLSAPGVEPRAGGVGTGNVDVAGNFDNPTNEEIPGTPKKAPKVSPFTGPYAAYGNKSEVDVANPPSIENKHLRFGWNMHQLTYLGRDSMLDFEPFSGRYTLWRFNRDNMRKCDAFNWPPTFKGAWTIKFHTLIFMGYNHLMDLDPLNGAYTISECDSKFFSQTQSTSSTFSCVASVQATLPDKAAQLHEATYLGQDLLLDYDKGSGEYTVYKYDRMGKNDDPSQPFTAVMSGTTSEGLKHTYLGNNFLLAYDPKTGGYMVHRFDRNSDFHESGPIAQGILDFNATGVPDPADHVIYSVMENTIMDYMPSTGAYRVIKLTWENHTVGEPLPAVDKFSAKMPEGEDACKDIEKWATCLNHTGDGRCGWCNDTSTCLRGDITGSCKGGCVAWEFPGMAKAPAGKPPLLKPTNHTNITNHSNPEKDEDPPPPALKEKALFIPRFDAHELYYIGRDAVLDYEPTSGHYRIWQMDRKADPSGEPFLSPPLVRGLWHIPLRRFIFLGFDRIFEYSPTSGRYNTWQCDHSHWAMGRPLQCSNVGSGKEVDTLSGDRQFVYMGLDTIFDFHRDGDFKVWRLIRNPSLDTDGTASFPSGEPVLTGKMPQFAGLKFQYMGSDLMLVYDPVTGAYSYFMVNRKITTVDDKLLEGPISEGAFDLKGHKLLSLMEDRILDIDPGSGEYRVMLCDRTPCEPTIQLAITGEANMAAVKPMVCDVMGTGIFRGDAMVEEEPQPNGFGHSLVFMEGKHDQHHVFDYDPTSGRYKIYSFQNFRKNSGPQCDALPQPPEMRGVWPFPDHQFMGLDRDMMLDYDLETGGFRVWTCDRRLYPKMRESQGYRYDKSLPCSPTAAGAWTELSKRNSSQLIYLGGDRILDWEPASAKYHIWEFTRQDKVPVLPGTKIASGSWAFLVKQQLVYIGSDMIFAIDPPSGSYKLMVYDRAAVGKATAIVGPISSGTFPSENNMFTYLGDDLVMQTDPLDGKYKISRCDRSHYVEGVALMCDVIGKGDLMKGASCNYTTCGACSLDPQCGWCAESGKCMQGGQKGPCAGDCPRSWMYGYCADEPCDFYHTCEDCLNTKQCGWCAESETCMAGGQHAPLFGQCGDYKYRWCTKPVGNATIIKL